MASHIVMTRAEERLAFRFGVAEIRVDVPLDGPVLKEYVCGRCFEFPHLKVTWRRMGASDVESVFVVPMLKEVSLEAGPYAFYIPRMDIEETLLEVKRIIDARCPLRVS